MTAEQILEEYPQLSRDDILAAIAYGAEMSRGRFVDLPGAKVGLAARGRSVVLGDFAQKTHAKSFVSRSGLGDFAQNATNTTGCQGR